MFKCSKKSSTLSLLMVGIRLQKDTKRKSVCTTTCFRIYVCLTASLTFLVRYLFVFKLLFALFWFQFGFYFFLLNDDFLLLLNIDFLSTVKYLVCFHSFVTTTNMTKITVSSISGLRMGGFSTVVFNIFPSQESSFWFVPNEDEFRLSKFDSSFS